ncbi:uncharacterized protein B0I36DRAFT_369487 [Microdochium trichocladiopsis]|uniref:BTB domain-containing protein n=1 Tax=Microdochium trichocladiopsis TaxID=1682393 RepID=A0A9P8XS69_9PEZI|nr:uncharacterized protein B0I36DRAFT_369487 [Microdochium trichocladiopsis]KAH7014540.1 hypothetical protein B0I36DRAFT_369487 [Microdochium trichocladiopsis]
MAIETHSIDNHGDLWLIVGEQVERDEDPACKLRVCSRTIARASPVFHAMLYGNWRESAKPNDGSDWIVNLPFDSGTSMRDLLGVIHGDSKAFATIGAQDSKDFSRMWGVLTAADKYSCLGVLGLWAPSWINACSQHVPQEDPNWDRTKEELNAELYPMLAAILYMLGSSDGYKKTVNLMVRRFKACHARNSSYFSPFEVYLEGLGERIHADQLALKKVYLKTTNDIMRSLWAGNPAAPSLVPRPHLCNTPEERSRCARQCFDNLVIALQNRKLWPLPKPESIKESPEELRWAIRKAHWGRQRCVVADAPDQWGHPKWETIEAFYVDGRSYAYKLTPEEKKALEKNKSIIDAGCVYTK